MILTLQDGRVMVVAEGLAQALRKERPNRGDCNEAAEVIEILIARTESMQSALKNAESFISGFEGDELQEGIDEMLATIRTAIAEAT